MDKDKKSTTFNHSTDKWEDGSLGESEEHARIKRVTFKPDRFTLYRQEQRISKDTPSWIPKGSGYLCAVDIDEGFNQVVVGSRISCGSITSRDAWYTTKVTKIVDYSNGICYAKTESGSLYKIVPHKVEED